MKRRIGMIAAILLFTAGAAWSMDPIGRLFFTPAQRRQLDSARIQHARGVSTPEPAEMTPPPKTVTYNGMVRRSDGKSTVWINNRPVQHRDPTGIAIERVRPDGAVTLKVPQANGDVRLKVGQSVDITSGTIEEPFERRIAAPATRTMTANETAGSAAEKTGNVLQEPTVGKVPKSNVRNVMPAPATRDGPK